jgi:antitoxin VapB
MREVNVMKTVSRVSSVKLWKDTGKQRRSSKQQKTSKQDTSGKTAKLFQNGKSQAVRLPKEFRFEGNEVYIRKQGEDVILSPRKAGWQQFWESLEMFSSDIFKDGRQQPKEVDKRDWLE